MKFKIYISLAIVLMAGCSTATQLALSPATLPDEVLDTAEAEQKAIGENTVKTTMPLGSGAINYAEAAGAIDPQAEQLILDYMTQYYQSLAMLELLDMDKFFYNPNSVEAMQSKLSLEYLVKTRAMQKNDLSLDFYTYTLTVKGTKMDKNGDLTVRVSEDSVQSFKYSPNTPAELYDAWHVFKLRLTPDGYKLDSHRDILSQSVIKKLPFNLIEENSESVTPTEFKNLLLDAERYTAERDTKFTAYTGNTPKYTYNREAAAEYALNWVDNINSDWGYYARYGGNCQNYVSQALLAGGIPMDTKGSALWKWYSDTPNNTNSVSGRSASWSSVSAFWSYASTNTGYGLVAHTSAPYYSGEIGDIIHMGTDDEFRHTVIITQLVQDSNGNTIDYLISSNTANYKNFPASAYPYTNQSLIKILGYNK